ncbi:hypothetical protein BDY19DRAFT_1050283 [Irpex rosettiformis]|uniref:Uncharacterized protein n=1 Tax=Irpex rosettiformis TaxID=378272 RepID=A0ACB8TVX0_9APHY|nr:hypothetical protein BDY19DRAFT_1050283 [Irpex rosettiformis]
MYEDGMRCKRRRRRREIASSNQWVKEIEKEARTESEVQPKKSEKKRERKGKSESTYALDCRASWPLTTRLVEDDEPVDEVSRKGNPNEKSGYLLDKDCASIALLLHDCEIGGEADEPGEGGDKACAQQTTRLLLQKAARAAAAAAAASDGKKASTSVESILGGFDSADAPVEGQAKLLGARRSVSDGDVKFNTGKDGLPWASNSAADKFKPRTDVGIAGTVGSEDNDVRRTAPEEDEVKDTSSDDEWCTLAVVFSGLLSSEIDTIDSSPSDVVAASPISLY